MDRSQKDFTTSTSIKPKFEIHGNDENELSEESALILKIADDNQSPVTDFKDSVRRKNILAKRNKTLDLQERPRLSKSFSYDSSASRLCVIDGEEVGKNSLHFQPYDPIKNYVSPRPKFLRYSPDKHREIIARQENDNRFIKSGSFDCGILFSDEEEEVESSVECSVEYSGEIIDESVGYSVTKDKDEEEDHDNNDDVEEEVLDDFVDHKGWSLSVFWQYLFVTIALILIASSIVLRNSPTHPLARDAKRAELGGEAFDSMLLMLGNSSNDEIDCVFYDEWYKKDAVEMQHDRIKDVCGDEAEELDLTESDYHDDINKITEVEETEDEQKSCYQLKGPVMITSKEIETREIKPEKKTYSHFNDKPEVVTMNNNGPDESKIKGIKTYGYLIRLASFDTKFAGFFGISVVTLVTLSVLCCSMMMKIWKNKVSKPSFGLKGSLFAESQERNFIQSYGNNYVSMTRSNASSSGQTEYSNYEMSTGDSPFIGSSTLKKKIIKKQKNKTPEVMISTVRRSSRIHNRSFMSSPTSLNTSY